MPEHRRFRTLGLAFAGLLVAALVLSLIHI